MEKFFVGVGAMICGWARGVLGVAWRWFGRILRRLMDSSTVTKPLDISAFDTCLKQIMCKYGNDFVMSVEATLGLLLVKHAFTTHMANAAAASTVKIEDPPKPQEERPNRPPEVTIVDDQEVVD